MDSKSKRRDKRGTSHLQTTSKAVDWLDVAGMRVVQPSPEKRSRRQEPIHIQEEHHSDKIYPISSSSSSSSSTPSPPFMASTAVAASPPHLMNDAGGGEGEWLSDRVLAADGDPYPTMGSGAPPVIPRNMDGGYPGGNWSGSMNGGGFTPGIGPADLYSDTQDHIDDEDDPTVIPQHYLRDNGVSDQDCFERLPALIKQFGLMNRGLYFTYGRQSHHKSNPATLLLPIQLVNMWLWADSGVALECRQFPTLASVDYAFRLVGPAVALTDNPKVYVGQRGIEFNTSSMTFHLKGWTETPNLALHSDYSYKTACKLALVLKTMRTSHGTGASRVCFQYQLTAIDNNIDAADLSLACSTADHTVGKVTILGYINGNAISDDQSTLSGVTSPEPIHRMLLCPPTDKVDACIMEQGYLPKVYLNLGSGFPRLLGFYRNRFNRQPLNITNYNNY